LSKTESKKYNLTVTVEIPSEVDGFLKKFAEFAGVSVEDILRTQLDADIEDFWHNEVLQDWLVAAIKNTGCAKFFRLNQVKLNG
jgi:hypothetical protein